MVHGDRPRHNERRLLFGAMHRPLRGVDDMFSHSQWLAILAIFACCDWPL